MDFKNEHMDYVLGFVLTFKCIFCYDFSSILFLYGFNIWSMMEKKKWIEKNYNKKINQQITMDSSMTKFGPNFLKSLSWLFFVGLIFFPPNMYVKFFLDGHPFIWTLLVD